MSLMDAIESAITTAVENYFKLNTTNVERLKAEGFPGKFSNGLVYGTVSAGMITGCLLVLVPLLSTGDWRYYFIAVPTVNIFIFVAILIQKVLHYKQIKKYRSNENNLIKP
jgi:hypothetical protein